MERNLSFVILISLSLIHCNNILSHTFISSPGDGESFVLNSTHKFSNRDTSFGIVTYYQNLYANCPSNLGSSCGFVSLAIYLSYFDSFRNDAIIPLAYERTSVGTNQEYVLSVSPGVQRLSKPDNQTLYDFVSLNKDTDYQCHLIDIYNNEIESNEYLDAIGMWDYQIILDELFGINNVPFTTFSWGDYANSYESEIVQTSLKTIAQNKILQGEPVVIHYHSGDSYHSVVGYAYDSDGIHAHFGWGSDSTDLIIGDDEYISEVGFANMSFFSNNHSKNYVINGLKYCGCGQHIYHTLSYSPVGPLLDGLDGNEYKLQESDNDLGSTRELPNLYHYATCECGYSILERHFFYIGHQLGICSGCGISTNYLLQRLEEDEN